MKVPLAAVTLCLAFLAACSAGGGGPATQHSAQPRVVMSGTPRLVSATIPHVRGLQASRALRLLHDAGFGTVRFTARRSAKVVGVVLAQRPRSGKTTPVRQQVALIISAGSRKAGARVAVPGVGSCEMALRPPKAPCVGGPVLVRVTAAHGPAR